MQAMLLLAAGAGTLACESSVTLIDPAADDAPGLVINMVAADSTLTALLEWEAGVPGADLFIRRDGDPFVSVFTGDSLGQVRIPDLPGARYWIWAERQLSDDERLRAGGVVRVLAGGTVRALSRGEELTIELAPNEPGSLVISEYHYHYPPVSLVGLPTYYYHAYLELFNNADTTVYLDGKIIGSGFNYNLDAALWPCVETEPFRNQPRGVYAQYLQAFPGSGREYPLGPGETVLIADQAIDHSAFYDGLPDHRGADFEFPFQDRADNPAVPNLIEVGLNPVTGSRNMRFHALFDVPFIMDGADIASLERATPKYQGEFALVPSELIIDLAAFTSSYYEVPRSALCYTQVSTALDHLSGVLGPDESQSDGHLISIHRKRLPGSSKLQRTRTTQADFIESARSPGRVP